MPSVLAFDEIHRFERGDNPFAPTDEIVRKYTRLTLRRFKRLKSRISTWDWDEEYLLLLWVNQCYDEIWGYYTSCLKECADSGYSQVAPGHTAHDDVVSEFVNATQSLEGYIPRNEWDRKRSRAFEELVAAHGRGEDVGKAVDDAAKRWQTQLIQSSDDLIVDGMLEAFEDAEVENLMWISQKDERVCSVCSGYDGQIFAIDKVPTWPAHYHCRCFLTPTDEPPSVERANQNGDNVPARIVRRNIAAVSESDRIDIDYSDNPRSAYGRMIKAGDYSRDNIVDRGTEWRDLFAHDMLMQHGYAVATHGQDSIDLTVNGRLYEVKSFNDPGGPPKQENPYRFIENEMRRAISQFRKRGIDESARIVMNFFYRPVDMEGAYAEIERRMLAKRVDEVIVIDPYGDIISFEKDNGQVPY